MINVADRDEVGKYFTGQIDETDCINQELKLQLASKNIVVGKRDQPVGGIEYFYIFRI